MAPETIKSASLTDARSDLYAVGAVGYYLLTAHPVFEAASVAEVFALHLQAEPTPPSQRTAARLPADLEAVILRCLSKNVADRPADARSLERELLRCTAAGSWTREDAAAWWRHFQTPAAVPHGEALDDAPTITVDLDGRLLARFGREPSSSLMPHRNQHH